MTSSSRDGLVTFRFYRPGASDVRVLGTFNGWCGDSLAMVATDDGWWTLEAELPGGDYRFRYWADGEWFTDFAANGVENAKHGWNSLLIVPEQKNAIIRNTMNEAAEINAADDSTNSDWTELRIGSDEQVSIAA